MGVAAVFAFVMTLLVVGAVLARLRLVPLDAAETLNAVAIHVCMPASILLHVPRLTLGREVLAIAAVPWLVLGVSVAVLVPVTRLLRLEPGARACVLLCSPLGNTAFLGYVLVPALAGRESLPFAVVYDQLGSFLILGTYGLFVVAVESGGTRPTVRTIARRVVTFTPFLALVASLTIVPRELPHAVTAGLELVANALLPIVALALGMQLRARLPRKDLAPLGLVMVAKLLLAPLLASVAVALLGLHGPARSAVVYQSAMPTMMTTAALLTTARLAPELAAAVVAFTTLASVVTLPLLRHLLS